MEWESSEKRRIIISDLDSMNQIQELSYYLRFLIESVASYRKKRFVNGGIFTGAWILESPKRDKQQRAYLSSAVSVRSFQSAQSALLTLNCCVL
jgi:pyruvate dehydrogenase complex dehydrogenase (E1) component